MQTILLVTVIIIILLIGLGMLIYFLIPKQGEQLVKDEIEEHFVADEQYSNERVTVVDVQFKGYNGKFTYAVIQQEVSKGQYVLVLTQDGIRCAKVITDPKSIKTSQLSFPPFLLQSIICVADEADLEYYN